MIEEIIEKPEVEDKTEAEAEPTGVEDLEVEDKPETEDKSKAKEDDDELSDLDSD